MARILIIDDEELVRVTLRQILEDAGHQVAEAVDGRQGTDLHEKLSCSGEPVDLIITDIVMPEQEGIETILEIRRGNSDVKIIAISGGGRRGDLGYLKLAQELGADGSLPKPFGPDELLTAVDNALAIKGMSG